MAIKMIYTIDNPKAVRFYLISEEENFTGVVKSKIGTIAYYLNGKMHQEDGSALIHSDSRKEYWLNSKQLNISTDQELKDFLILRMFE